MGWHGGVIGMVDRRKIATRTKLCAKSVNVEGRYIGKWQSGLEN